MTNIPDDVLEILEELVIYEEVYRQQEPEREFLELEYLDNVDDDIYINIDDKSEGYSIIHIKL